MFICFDDLYISEGFTLQEVCFKAHLNYTNPENVTHFGD